MKIDEKELTSIFGSDFQINEEIKVSLFIVSNKNPRLKKLDLDPRLSSKARAEKLKKWSKSQRFVAIIEISDQIYAHTHAKHAVRLQDHTDLSIDGKKVTVQALSDEAYERLSAVGEAFGEYVLAENDQPDEKMEVAKKANPKKERQYYAARSLMSDQMTMNHWIAHLSNIPSKVILAVLDSFRKARYEDNEQRKLEDKQIERLRTEINRDILQEQIKKTEIKRQDLKKTSL